jgi:hypothetical protein
MKAKIIKLEIILQEIKAKIIKLEIITIESIKITKT